MSTKNTICNLLLRVQFDAGGCLMLNEYDGGKRVCSYPFSLAMLDQVFDKHGFDVRQRITCLIDMANMCSDSETMGLLMDYAKLLLARYEQLYDMSQEALRIDARFDAVKNRRSGKCGKGQNEENMESESRPLCGLPYTFEKARPWVLGEQGLSYCRKYAERYFVQPNQVDAFMRILCFDETGPEISVCWKAPVYQLAYLFKYLLGNSQEPFVLAEDYSCMGRVLKAGSYSSRAVMLRQSGGSPRHWQLVSERFYQRGKGPINAQSLKTMANESMYCHRNDIRTVLAFLLPIAEGTPD